MLQRYIFFLKIQHEIIFFIFFEKNVFCIKIISIFAHANGEVAQLVRASDSEPGGHEFNSHPRYKT